MMELSEDDILHDLKTAAPDDIVFNKTLFAELTNQPLPENSKSNTEVELCYENVLKYLYDEKELKTLCSELKDKTEVLKQIQKTLQESVVKLKDDADVLAEKTISVT